MSISQKDFEYLIKLVKEFDEKSPLDLNNEWSREISSLDTNDKFVLDYRKGYIKMEKYSFNKRYRKSIILLRFCSEGRHTNPGGNPFNGPHVHLYRKDMMINWRLIYLA